MMGNTNRLTFLILLAAMFSAACEKENASVLGENYPESVRNILILNCANGGCHSGNSPSAGLDVSDWAKLHNGSKDNTVLIPHSSDWSMLFQHANTYDELGPRALPVMPLNGSVLSKDDMLTLKKWINEGAPNKTGDLFWRNKEQVTQGKVFSLCAGSDLIAVSDLESNLIMRYIEVGQFPEITEAPHYITLSPDGKFAYVSLIGGAALEKFRTDTYEKVGRVIIGADPSIIKLNAAGTLALITHWNSTQASPKLTLVRTSDMTILDQIKGNGELLSFPHGIEVSEDFKTLYVVANTGNYYAKITLDGETFVDKEDVALEPEVSPNPQPSNAYMPYFCVLSPDGKKLYITLTAKNQVWVYEVATGKLLARIPTGRHPRLMTMDERNNRLYVVCRDEPNPSKVLVPDDHGHGGGTVELKGCISVIDMSTNQNLKNILNVGHQPHGISLSKSMNRLYVSSENQGGIDPPHHPTTGTDGALGKYNVIDLQTLESLPDLETDIAVFPNALVVSDK